MRNTLRLRIRRFLRRISTTNLLARDLDLRGRVSGICSALLFRVPLVFDAEAVKGGG